MIARTHPAILILISLGPARTTCMFPRGNFGFRFGSPWSHTWGSFFLLFWLTLRSSSIEFASRLRHASGIQLFPCFGQMLFIACSKAPSDSSRITLFGGALRPFTRWQSAQTSVPQTADGFVIHLLQHCRSELYTVDLRRLWQTLICLSVSVFLACILELSLYPVPT